MKVDSFDAAGALARAERRWQKAFDNLEEEEKMLLIAEEATMGTTSSTREKVKVAVERSLKDYNTKHWAVTFKGKPLRLREVGEKLACYLLASRDIIAAACASSPYASLAWSGISTILCLIGVPSQQNEAMMDGLTLLIDLIELYRVRDQLYHDKISERQKLRSYFADLLTELYTKILSYQVQTIKHLRHNKIHRAGSSLAKSSNWVGRVKEIKDLDTKCSRYLEHF